MKQVEMSNVVESVRGSEIFFCRGARVEMTSERDTFLEHFHFKTSSLPPLSRCSAKQSEYYALFYAEILSNALPIVLTARRANVNTYSRA